MNDKEIAQTIQEAKELIGKAQKETFCPTANTFSIEAIAKLLLVIADIEAKKYYGGSVE